MKNYPQVNAKLKEDVKRWLVEKSKKEQRSQSWIVSQMIKREMEKELKGVN